MLKKIELPFIEKAQKMYNLEPTAYQLYTGNINKLHTIMLAQCFQTARQGFESRPGASPHIAV